ncbi:MAG: hypothetical protein OXK79_00190 [Chloroflexota bacterium]|nr:hypothetical protein [Chloroflexota bacterium]
MVEDYNRHLAEQQTLSEGQRHANMAEAAKRAQEHYQPPSKPHSEIGDRLYRIARVVFPAIAIVGLLAMFGFAVWIVVTSG